MAHVDAGKTTTTERILFYSGATSRIGEVDDGSAVTDWMAQEQERGISITSAATTFGWGSPRHVVNLIDTPGHVDFTMEVERSLRVLDGAIAVFCAVAGVESQSETVWRQADRYRVPRLAFINKCDREGAEPERVMAEMRTRLGATPIAIQVPLFAPRSSKSGVLIDSFRAAGATFEGVIDLVTMRARTWDAASFGAKFTDGPIPHSHMALASRAREQMIEAISEHDDELMAAWVSGREVSPEALRAALRRVTLSGRGVPTLVGAAFKNQGIHNLLDAVIDYLPSPADVDHIRGRDPQDPTAAPSLTRAIGDEEPLAALAFKVQNDGHGGHFTFVRVYSGCLKVGDAVLDAAKGHLEQIGRLVRMFANHREDIRQIEAGMIGAVFQPSGTGKLATGDTLCDPRFPILLDPIAVPSAVMGVVVVPETDEDHAKLAHALERLAVEDPSFRVRTDLESGQVVISGMGELHLEIVVDRLRREFGIRARIGTPQVAYRETVTRRGEGENKFIRVAGGPGGPRGEYGHVQLVVEPTDRGGGYIYENRASTSEIPQEHAPAVEAGVTEAVERGVLAGHPMTDLRVQVVGGSYHPVDSNNYAFKVAGSKALVAATTTAAPTLLEPVMSLEVTTPDEYVGEVLGDLHARRGKVTGITTRPGVQTVACFVPMASMFGYATDLRSRTRGRATYAMELDHYAELPHQLRDDLMSRHARA
ncbi:MAG: elongation factor G [Kofleriaceae bacterium]